MKLNEIKLPKSQPRSLFREVKDEDIKYFELEILFDYSGGFGFDYRPDFGISIENQTLRFKFKTREDLKNFLNKTIFPYKINCYSFWVIDKNDSGTSWED